MWMKLTPNECVERALQAPSQSIERRWWFDLAQLMIEVDQTPAPIESGLTIQKGGSYTQQAWLSRQSRIERIHRYGINY